MALIETDIVYRLTETTGPAGDTNAQADPDASIGGYASTTELDISTGNTLNNLFRDVTDGERTAGIILYRSIFVANENATDTWTLPVGWLKSEVAGGGTIAMGVDPEGVVPTDYAYQQGAICADEETAPAGVTFSSPTTKATGIEVGENVPAGSGYMVHYRLTVPSGAPAINFDGCTPRWEQG